MIVAYDVSYIQSGAAGIGRYSFELLRDLLDIDTRNEYVLHGWSLKVNRDLIRTLQRENVRCSLSRIPGPGKRFYWNRLRTPSLQRLIGRFDIFHSAEPLLPPIAPARGIVTVHDLAYVKHPELFERSVVARDQFVRRSVRDSSAIIVPSLHTKSDLINLLGVDERKIILIRPPVHRECSPVKDVDGDEAVRRKYGLHSPFALFVGVIEPRKNVGGIIKAFEFLHERAHMDLDLVLAGRDGWLYQDTIRLIGLSRERSRIHRLYFVPDADLMSLYRLARFFVYPSFYEGYGSPVAEAMASGLPTITSRNTSLQEIGGTSVVLVDPENTEELSSAMWELAGNEETRARLAASGILRMREIHAESAARATMALYEETGVQ